MNTSFLGLTLPQTNKYCIPLLETLVMVQEAINRVKHAEITCLDTYFA
jgi:hypothetical protein